jgi:hypothetical protein
MTWFFTGALATLSFVAAVFFWTFYRRTKDTLFGAFCAGFATFGVHWTVLGLTHPSNETRHYHYLLRFVAFLFIIYGVVAKNRHAPSGRVATIPLSKPMNGSRSKPD